MSASTRKGSAKLVLLFAAILMAAIVTPPTKAFAANTANSTYSFSFSGTGATQGTGARYKETSTVCYLRVTYLGLNRMNFYIDGAKSAS